MRNILRRAAKLKFLCAALVALAPLSAHSALLSGTMTVTAVPCSEIDASWTNANSSNTFGDLYRSEDPAFASGITHVFHFQGNNRFLHTGTVTYKDATGLVPGHTYYYRITVVKTGGGGSTESQTSAGATLPTTNCLDTTVTTVTAVPNDLTTGQSGTVTLTAHVANAAGPYSAPPTGVIDITVNDSTDTTLTGGDFPATPVDANGDAIVSMPASVVSGSAGTYTVKAIYLGDSFHNASPPGTATITVGLSPTTTSVINSSSNNPSIYGDTVTFTATVGPAAATGDVKFFDDNGSTLLATVTLDSSNQASFAISTLSAVSHSITAAYQTDGSYGNSTSSVLVQVVNPKDLTVTGITASNKIYDGFATATIDYAGAALVGVIAGDNVTLNTGSTTGAFASPNVANGITVTIPPLTISGTSSGNYTLTQPTTTANITPVTLTPGTGNGTINVQGNTNIYDGVAHGATGSATGVNGEDLSSLLHLGSSFTAVPGGTANWVFDGDGNYNSDSGSVQIVINQKPASVTPAAAGKAYGAADPTFTGSLSGFLAGDNVTATYSRTPGETVAGSPYTISATLSPVGVLGNYDITSNTAAFTIDKTTLIHGPGGIDVEGNTNIYDGAAHGATGSAKGVNGENLNNLLHLGSSFTAVPGGTANWVFDGDANYNSDSGSVQIVINQKPASVTPAAASKAYGAADPTFTGTLSGFVAGDNVIATYSRTAGETVAGSPYTISATLNPAGVLGNYDITSNTAAFTITKADLPIGPPAGSPGITVTAYAVTYDGISHTAAGTAIGFQPGEDLSSLLNLSGTTHRDAGVYNGDIWTFAGNANYNPANGTVNDNIAKRAITVTAVPDNRPYNGTTASSKIPTVTPAPAPGDTAHFIQTFDSPDVSGQKTLTPSGSVADGNNGNNYAYDLKSITINTAAITAAAVQPDITAASKTYDGNTSATIATRGLSGVVAGDSVTLTGGTATFADPNVGSGKTVTATGLTLSGPDAGNYALTTTTATATADITKANQTIAFTALPNKIFGDTPFTVTATASSGLPVTLVIKSGPATISGDTVTLTAVGQVTLTASQEGNGNYNAATPVDQTFATLPPPALLNISTRGRVGTGNDVLIGGYIVKGVEPKKFAAIGLGPSLKSQALPEVVADPTLELHGPDGALLFQNDNFADTQLDEIQASGLKPTDPLESAIIASEPPGNYTAIVRDKTGAGGIGLVALYDLSQTSNSTLANISTRGLVGTGDDVLIGGFIVNGNVGAAKVIVRAIGPSLTQFGIQNFLANPTLELHDQDGALIGSNDNWQDDPAQAALIQASTIPPQNGLESAIVTSLPPANYTVIVAGKNGTKGVAVVEVYDLTNN